MKASFPTVIDAVFMGKSRNAGSFEDQDGMEVKYGENFAFAFDASDGTTQTVNISDKRLEKVGLNPRELKKLTPVRIVGDAVITPKGGFFEPTEIAAAKS